MSISATITPLEGWDIVGEMKMRLDVENNDLEMGFPKTVRGFLLWGGCGMGFPFPAG